MRHFRRHTVRWSVVRSSLSATPKGLFPPFESQLGRWDSRVQSRRLLQAPKKKGTPCPKHLNISSAPKPPFIVPLLSRSAPFFNIRAQHPTKMSNSSPNLHAANHFQFPRQATNVRRTCDEMRRASSTDATNIRRASDDTRRHATNPIPNCHRPQPTVTSPP
jgi:hypothetical protein